MSLAVQVGGAWEQRLCVKGIQFYFLNAGKWRDHPVAITAYSYFFGAVFMGLASLYVFPVGKSEEYKIPSQVSLGLYALTVIQILF